MQSSNHSKGILIALTGVLVATPDALLVRLISADVWTTLFWRGTLTFVAITVALAFVHKRNLLRLFMSIGIPGLMMAFIFSLGTIFFLFALINTSVANALFIGSISPLISALIARFVFKDAIPFRTWMAICLSLVGIGVIASGSINQGGSSLWGDVSAVLAATAIAIMFSIARRYRDRNMVPAIGVSYLMTAILVLPFCAPLAVSAMDMTWIPIMGLVVIPVSYSMMTMGTRYIPAEEVGLLVLLQSVLGPYWVWLVIGETPAPETIIGGGIVLITLATMNILTLISVRQQRALSANYAA